MIVASRVLVLIAVLLGSSIRAQAHELGSTRVHLTLGPGATYEVAIVGDPEALLSRLETLQRVSTGPNTGPSDERLTTLSAFLVENAQVRIDGGQAVLELVPGFQAAPEEQAGQSSSLPKAIVLRGVLPSGARVLSWRCSFLYGSYPLVVSGSERVVRWVRGPGVSDPIEIGNIGGDVSGVLAYARLGVLHIVPGGLDHVLFVVAIVLIRARLRQVFVQISAFTLAHSLTLGLSLYGVMSMPTGIVEPLIALSIAYVALENLLTSSVRPHRVFVVFAFGLLHGLGFAGALMELSLPRSRFLQALIGFNVGVEIGQLTVVAIACAVALPFSCRPAAFRRFLAVPASCLIAVTGIVWTIGRLVD
jgi:HupE / UreJ protein